MSRVRLKFFYNSQDHLYVQYVEMVVFQNEFQELVVRFKENEKIIQDIPVTGSDLAEVNAHLDSLENLMEVTSQAQSYGHLSF